MRLLREVWTETKFYARDVFRGPNAKSLPGYLAFGVLTGLSAGALLGLAVIGLLEVTSGL